DLSKSTLYEAQINDCSLVRAKLHNVLMIGAKFERCDASGCFAEDCTFLKVTLTSINLQQAHLERTTWIENDLRGSAFDRASLVSATFVGTDLREVGFRAARL